MKDDEKKHLNLSSTKISILINNFSLILSMILLLIITPYVTRVLGPAGIGKVNFALTFVNYFVIIANLGFNIYATREIAFVKKNRNELISKHSSFFKINFISTIITSLIYIFLVFFVNKFNNDLVLFLILGIYLFSNFFQIKWIFLGLEKFYYYSLIQIISNLINFFLIFILVTKPHDYLIYGFLSILPFLLINVLTMIISFKFIKIKIKERINLSLIKKSFPFYIYILLTDFYLFFDRVLLGLIASDASVGYYSISSNLIKIITLLIASNGLILMPIVSYYLINDDKLKMKSISKFMLNSIYFVSLSAIVVFIFLGPEIIFVIGGAKFSESVIVLQLLSPIILFSGLSNYLLNQALIPNKKEKFILITVFIGFALSLILNILFIPSLDYIGTALTATIVEFSIFSFLFIYVKIRIKPFSFLTESLRNYLIGSLIIGIILFSVNKLSLSILVKIGFILPMIFFFYFIFLIKIKDPFIYPMYSSSIRILCFRFNLK